MHITGLINVLASGRAPEEVASFLAGAPLIRLTKEDGGLRPIANGEVLRRLTAKYLCELSKEDVHRHLWPLQIGVASPLGSEIDVHVTRHMVEKECRIIWESTLDDYSVSKFF